MGSVYSADRVDGELSQTVAVKLLRPGVDDLNLRQRFLAERQIRRRVNTARAITSRIGWK